MAERLKNVNLKDNVGKTIEFCALLKDIKYGTIKNGAGMITLLVMDGKTEVDIVKFGVSESIVSGYTLGGVYEFQVLVKKYEQGRNGLSLGLEKSTITNMNHEDFTIMEEGYVESCNYIFSVLNRLKGTIVGNIAYQALQADWEKFSMLPAASSMHHIYKGGLVVHTASVCEISEAIADLYLKRYPSALISKPLLLAGALLHDIGKVTEYECTESGAKYSGAGVLTPHIISGISKISAIATSQGTLSTPQVQELIHLIASHHGRAEWGSPIEPHSIEADILSNADLIDSTVSRRLILNTGEVPGEGKSKRQGGQNFSTYVSVPDPATLKI